MNSCELVTLITSIAIIIADQVEDNDELALLGSVLSQLGDTLNTISAQRALQESKADQSKSPSV